MTEVSASVNSLPNEVIKVSDYNPPNRYQPLPADLPGIVEQIQNPWEQAHTLDYLLNQRREQLQQQLGRDLTAEELQRIEQTNQRW